MKVPQRSFLLFFTPALWVVLAGVPGASWLPSAAALCGAFLGLAAILLFLNPGARSNPRRSVTALALLAVGLGLLSGAGRIHVWNEQRRSFYTGIPLASVSGFEGILIRDSGSRAGGDTVYQVRLIRVRQGGGKVASARGLAEVAVRGGRMLPWGRLIKVEAGLESRPELYRAPLFARAQAGKLRAEDEPPGILGLRARARDALLARMKRLQGKGEPLLQALIMGEREEMSPDLMERFRRSGSLHLLALSGLHLGILILWVRLPLLFVTRRWIRFLASVSAAAAYLFLIGFLPSLLRAAAMLLAAAAASLLDRDWEPLNLLALAACGILLADPSAAVGLSFQLSVAAVGGILLLGPFLSHFLRRYLPALLEAPLSITLAAQMATSPLVLSSFGFVPLGGLPASLLLVPLVTAFIWTGLFALLAGALLPGLEGPLGWILDGMRRLIMLGASFWGKLPALRLDWDTCYWLPVALLFLYLIYMHPVRRPIDAR